MKNCLFLISLLLMPVVTFAQLNCSGGTFGCLGLTDGQVPIGRTGNTPVGAGLTGTTNQVNIANASGSVTLSTPQSIATASSVTFGGVTLGGSGIFSTPNQGNQLGGAGGSSSSPATSNTNIVLYNNGASNWAGLGSDTSGNMYFVTGTSGTPSTRMLIDTTGRVGINGTAPVSLLSVNGNGATGYTFYVNSGTSGLNGRVYIPNVTTSGSVQTDYLCLASTGEVIADTGLCLASSEKNKNWLGDMTCEEASRIVGGMKPGWFQYKNEGMPPERADWSIHAGFLAEEVEKVEPRLVNYTKEGEPRGVQYEMFSVVLARYLQCLKN